jgi:dephospho-CoA kinase
MILLGLTGSIGMGKTTAAAMFREEGAPVYDADAAVHALYLPGGGAVASLAALFPSVLRDGGIDRQALSAAVLHDPEAMRRLEEIVHPLAREAQAVFLQQAEAAGAPVVVMDVPLLFETGGDAHMDAVAVVSAPEAVQRARVLARPGMTPEKFAHILTRQLPDAEKRRRADFVISTALDLEDTRAQVRAILAVLRDAA